MPGLLGRKWPAPVGGPLAPFYIAGLAVLYGVNSAQNSMMQSDEWKNDPRNPLAKDKTNSGAH